MNLPVLVLAGGRGTRMRPLTDKLPKCLLDVAGKPFLVRQIAWLRDQGLSDITLSLGYRAPQVIAALTPNATDFKYSYAPDCGIQGAIRAAQMTQPFYLLYGDVLPRYTAVDLFDHYYAFDSLMGKCAAYYDTGFSIISPTMQCLGFIDVPPSLEIGSLAGYVEMRAHFGDHSPLFV